MPNAALSKSTFLRGLQCEKSLWLYKNRYSEKDPVDPLQEAIFAQGTEVGLVAQQLFPGGQDGSVSHFEQEAGASKTRKLLHAGEKVIYEAVFIEEGVYVAVDILVRSGESWHVYEVKSSTSMKDTYLDDAAIQYAVLERAGILPEEFYLMYINNQYLREGALEIRKLFILEPVLEKIKKRLDGIPASISRFKEMIRLPEPPPVEIGEQCFSPYTCDFKGSCWKEVPEYSVFDISNLGKRRMFEMYYQGIRTLQQVDSEQQRFSAGQKLQIQCEQTGKGHLEKEKVEKFLNRLEYPLYFLDFETYAPAIPIYDHSKPYQHLVFQYSLHVQEVADGPLKHREYLAEPDPLKDPRKELMEQMIRDLGSKGDILVYNIKFERGRIEDAVSQFSGMAAALTAVLSRLKDLMVPFQEKWYYTPAMKGSYSIKNVLPALVPDMSYADLDIRDGGTASLVYYQMVRGTYAGDEEKAKEQLLAYCKMDTLAMVRILEVLQKAVMR